MQLLPSLTNLSSNSRNQRVEGEIQLPGIVLWIPYQQQGTCTRILSKQINRCHSKFLKRIWLCNDKQQVLRCMTDKLMIRGSQQCSSSLSLRPDYKERWWYNSVQGQSKPGSKCFSSGPKAEESQCPGSRQLGKRSSLLWGEGESVFLLCLDLHGLDNEHHSQSGTCPTAHHVTHVFPSRITSQTCP